MPNHSGAMIALRVPDPEMYAINPPTEETTPADELHITLGYLGEAAEISPEQREAVLEAVQVLADTADAPKGLFPATQGVFPPDPESQDAIPMAPYYAAPSNTENFNSLREDLLVHLSARGVADLVSTKHPVFHPHVTLAYAPLDTPPDLSHLPTPMPTTFGDIIVRFGDEEHLFSLNRQAEGPELPLTASVRSTLSTLSDRKRISEDYLTSLYLRQRQVRSTPAQTRAQAALEAVTAAVDPSYRTKGYHRIEELTRRAHLEADPVSRTFSATRALALAGRTPAPEGPNEARELAALTASLRALIADGNSSVARSLRARAQLRDRYGRWIEQGGGVRFKVRQPGTPGGGYWVHGTVEGFDIPNGRVNVKLEDGRVVAIPNKKLEQPKAILGLDIGKAIDSAKKFLPKSAGKKNKATLPDDHDPETAATAKAQDDAAVEAMDRMQKDLQETYPDATVSGGNIAPLVNDPRLKEEEPAARDAGGGKVTFQPTKTPKGTSNKDAEVTFDLNDVDTVRASLDRLTTENSPAQDELDDMSEAERNKALATARSKAYGRLATLYNERGADEDLLRAPSVGTEEELEEVAPEATSSTEGAPTPQELVDAANDAYVQLQDGVDRTGHWDKVRERIGTTLSSANRRFLDGTDDQDTYLNNLDRIKEYANSQEPIFKSAGVTIDPDQEAFSAFAEDIDDIHAAGGGTDDVAKAREALTNARSLIDGATQWEGDDGPQGWTSDLEDLNIQAATIEDNIGNGTYLEDPESLINDLRELGKALVSSEDYGIQADMDEAQGVNAELIDAAGILEGNAPSAAKAEIPEVEEAPEEDLPEGSDDPDAYFEEEDPVQEGLTEIMGNLADLLVNPDGAYKNIEQPEADASMSTLMDTLSELGDSALTVDLDEAADIIESHTAVIANELKDLATWDQDKLETFVDSAERFASTLRDSMPNPDLQPSETGKSSVDEAPAADLPEFQDIYNSISELDDIEGDEFLEEPFAAVANTVINTGKSLTQGKITNEKAAEYLGNALGEITTIKDDLENADKFDGTPLGDDVAEIESDIQTLHQKLNTASIEEETPEAPEEAPEPEVPEEPEVPAPSAEIVEAQNVLNNALSNRQEELDQEPDFESGQGKDWKEPVKAKEDFGRAIGQINSAIDAFKAGSIDGDQLRVAVNNAADAWHTSDGYEEIGQMDETGALADRFYIGDDISEFFDSVPELSDGTPDDVDPGPVKPTVEDPWAVPETPTSPAIYDTPTPAVEAALDEALSEWPESELVKVLNNPDALLFLDELDTTMHTAQAATKKRGSTKSPQPPAILGAPEGSTVVGTWQKRGLQTINGASSYSYLVRHPDGSMHVYTHSTSVATGMDRVTSSPYSKTVHGDGAGGKWVTAGGADVGEIEENVADALNAVHLYSDILDDYDPGDGDDSDAAAVVEGEKERIQDLITDLEGAVAEDLPDTPNSDFITDPAVIQEIINQLRDKESPIASMLADHIEGKLNAGEGLTESDIDSLKGFIDWVAEAPSNTDDEKADYTNVSDDLDVRAAAPAPAEDVPDTAEEVGTDPEGPLADWEKELLDYTEPADDFNAEGALEIDEAKAAWKTSLDEYLAAGGKAYAPGTGASEIHTPLSDSQKENFKKIMPDLPGALEMKLGNLVSAHNAGDANDDELIQGISEILLDVPFSSKLRGRLRGAQAGVQQNKGVLIPILRPKPDAYKGSGALMEGDLVLSSPEVVKGTLQAVIKQSQSGNDLKGIKDADEDGLATKEAIEAAGEQLTGALDAFNSGDIEGMIGSMREALNLYDKAINLRKKVHKADTVVRRLRARRRALDEVLAGFEGRWPDPKIMGNPQQSNDYYNYSPQKSQLDREGNAVYPGDKIRRTNKTALDQTGLVLGWKQLTNGKWTAHLWLDAEQKDRPQGVTQSMFVIDAVGPNNPLYSDPSYTGPRVDDEMNAFIEEKKAAVEANQAKKQAAKAAKSGAEEPTPAAAPKAPAPNDPDALYAAYTNEIDAATESAELVDIAKRVLLDGLPVLGVKNFNLLMKKIDDKHKQSFGGKGIIDALTDENADTTASPPSTFTGEIDAATTAEQVGDVVAKINAAFDAGEIPESLYSNLINKADAKINELEGNNGGGGTRVPSAPTPPSAPGGAVQSPSPGEDLAGHPGITEELDALPNGAEVAVESYNGAWDGNWVKENGEWVMPGTDGVATSEQLGSAPVDSMVVLGNDMDGNEGFTPAYGSYVIDIQNAQTEQELESLSEEIPIDLKNGHITQHESELLNDLLDVQYNNLGLGGGFEDDTQKPQTGPQEDLPVFHALPHNMQGKKGEEYVFVNGQRKWGRYGAAGIAVTSVDADGNPKVLLGKRGDTGVWYLPGGALEELENPIQGATREFHEEVLDGESITPSLSLVDTIESNLGKISVIDKNGQMVETEDDWKYTILVANLPETVDIQAPPDAASYEFVDYVWADADELAAMDAAGSLHPALADGKFAKQIGMQQTEEIGAPEDVEAPSVNVDLDTAGPEDLSQPKYDTSDWKKVGGSLGSQVGGTYEDPDGNRYYVKVPHTEQHAHNEVVAAKFYEAMGIAVPQVRLGTAADGSLRIVSPMVEGANDTALADAVYKSNGDLSFISKVRDGFAVDAWMGNYDVTGLGFDNIIADADGSPVRVDNGGTFQYRATGSHKWWWGKDVTDLHDMRNGAVGKSSAYGSASTIFGGMTDEEIRESAKKLAGLSPKEIEGIVNSTGMDADMKFDLIDTLIKRRHNILEETGLLSDESNVASTTSDPGETELKDAKEVVKETSPPAPKYKIGDKVYHHLSGPDEEELTVKEVLGNGWVLLTTEDDPYGTVYPPGDILPAGSPNPGFIVHVDGHNYMAGETVYFKLFMDKTWYKGTLDNTPYHEETGSISVTDADAGSSHYINIGSIITEEAHNALHPAGTPKKYGTPVEQATSLGDGYAEVPAGATVHKKKEYSDTWYAVEHSDGSFWIYKSDGKAIPSFGKSPESFKAEKGWVDANINISPIAVPEAASSDSATSLPSDYTQPPTGAKVLFKGPLDDGEIPYVVQHADGSMHMYRPTTTTKSVPGTGGINPLGTTPEHFEVLPDWESVTGADTPATVEEPHDGMFDQNGSPIKHGAELEVTKYKPKGWSGPMFGTVVNAIPNALGQVKIRVHDDNGMPAFKEDGKPWFKLVNPQYTKLSGTTGAQNPVQPSVPSPSGKVWDFSPTEVISQPEGTTGLPQGVTLLPTDESHPLYGTPAPTPPTPPGDVVGGALDESWIARANEAYKARKLKKYPDKAPGEVQSSGIWQSQYAKAVQGDADAVKYLNNNGYFESDPTLYAEATELIETRNAAIAKLVSAYKVEQKAYSKAQAEWMEANGNAVYTPVHPSEAKAMSKNQMKSWAKKKFDGVWQKLSSSARQGLKNQKGSSSWQAKMRILDKTLGLTREAVAAESTNSQMQTWDAIKEAADQSGKLGETVRAIRTVSMARFANAAGVSYKDSGATYEHQDLRDIIGTIQKDHGAMEITFGSLDDGGMAGFSGGWNGENYDVTVDLTVPADAKGTFTGLGVDYGDEDGWIAEPGTAMYIWDVVPDPGYTGGTHPKWKVIASIIPNEVLPFVNNFEGAPGSQPIYIPSKDGPLPGEKYTPNALIEGGTYTEMPEGYSGNQADPEL